MDVLRCPIIARRGQCPRPPLETRMHLIPLSQLIVHRFVQGKHRPIVRLPKTSLSSRQWQAVGADRQQECFRNFL
jgi:hypothetical protein